MGQYSISDLENLSGIKAHTIRIWEQRYGILQPVRTSTNIRTYCDSDLRRLLNVATLCSRGHRISRVAQLSEEELSAAVVLCCEDAHDYVQQVNALLAAMLELNEIRLGTLFARTIDQLGFEQAVLRVAYPFLQRIGIMWQAGTVHPAQEHLVSHILRQKIIAATDQLPLVPPAADVRRWVLFLPEGELHELALLFMNYALRARGHHVLYLGQNLPVAELGAVYAIYKPHSVCTVLTAAPERDRVQEYIDELAGLCPGVALFLYGPLAQQEGLKLAPHIVRLQMMTDFLACLQPETVGNTAI